MFLVFFLLVFSKTIFSQNYSIGNLTQVSQILGSFNQEQGLFNFVNNISYSSIIDNPPMEIVVPQNNSITFMFIT